MSIFATVPLLVEKPWGGTILKERGKRLGAKIPSLIVGESFEVSNLLNYETLVQPHDQSDLLKNFNLTYLVKYIETKEHLSVQVHPDDILAKQLENSKGKTECWYILDCKPGAGIYIGLKSGVTITSLKKAILNNEDISIYLNFVPVSKNQFFVVPAGTIHAIGKDILLLEVQQNSGITYRLWDWNRVDQDGKGRELHIEKGMRAVNDDRNFNEKTLIAKHVSNVLKPSEILFKHNDFQVNSFIVEGEKQIELEVNEQLKSFFILEGKGTIDGVDYQNSDSFVLLEKKAKISFFASERTHCLCVS